MKTAQAHNAQLTGIVETDSGRAVAILTDLIQSHLLRLSAADKMVDGWLEDKFPRNGSSLLTEDDLDALLTVLRGNK